MVRRRSDNKQIDLHGKGADEAVDYFISISNSFLASGQRGHIVVIHGYGSHGLGNGAIKQRIRELVTRWTDYFDAIHCDDSMPGETWVIPLKPFPRRTKSGRNLEQQICDFCVTRKTEKQIVERFHHRTASEIETLLNDLKRRRMLEEVMKKGTTAWRIPSTTADPRHPDFDDDFKDTVQARCGRDIPLTSKSTYSGHAWTKDLVARKTLPR
jgi:hypothetical protein